MCCVWQDPVYGKGKLGEIQGLILGMLDTFTYEQVRACRVVMIVVETSQSVE